MNTSINERFMKVLSLKGISNYEYAKHIKTSRANISNWATNKNAIPLDRIVQLLEIYPEVSAEWLIMGKRSFEHIDGVKHLIDPDAKPLNSSDKDYVKELRKDLNKVFKAVNQMKGIIDGIILNRSGEDLLDEEDSEDEKLQIEDSSKKGQIKTAIPDKK